MNRAAAPQPTNWLINIYLTSRTERSAAVQALKDAGVPRSAYQYQPRSAGHQAGESEYLVSMDVDDNPDHPMRRLVYLMQARDINSECQADR